VLYKKFLNGLPGHLITNGKKKSENKEKIREDPVILQCEYLLAKKKSTSQ